MKNPFLFLAFFFSSTIIFAQNKEKKREGDIREQRDLRNFTTIDANLAADFFIRQADTFSFVAVGSEWALERMKTQVQNGKLIISKQTNWQVWNEVSKVKIYITVPYLDELLPSGVGNVALQGNWTGEKMHIKLEGAYNVSAHNVNLEDLKVELNGVGNLDIGGKAEQAHLTLNGSGTINAYDLVVQNAKCTVNGVGKLLCFVREDLIADVAGLGSVHYRGEPKNVRSSINGLGKVKAD